jgi:hypothetical protein
MKLFKKKIKRENARTEEENFDVVMSIHGKSLKKKMDILKGISESEFVNSINQQPMIEELVDSIPKDVETALFVGCGDGTEMKVAESRGIEATGIQVNPEETKQIEEKGLYARTMDMHDMSWFDEGEFDLVFYKDAFKQSPMPIVAFVEAASITSKYILISEPCEKWRDRARNFQLLTRNQFEGMAIKCNCTLDKYWETKLPYVTQRHFLFKKNEWKT